MSTVEKRDEHESGFRYEMMVLMEYDAKNYSETFLTEHPSYMIYLLY